MRVVVLGGYGLFGSRISHRLGEDGGFEVYVAGRHPASAERLIAQWSDSAQRQARAVRLDTTSPDFASDLRALAPDIVIDTAGPFQTRALDVPRAVLACGAHAIDLADGRDYVARFTELDAEARAAGKLAVTGASSVPGISTAVVAALAPRFAQLESLSIGISPGNRTPRGLATTQAILGYVGKPIRMLLGGQWRTAHGWQSLRRLVVPGVGPRWFARCEVPDLDLLPARWPSLTTCDFRAGLELKRMHHGLWLASWAVRAGLLRSMAPFAKPLLFLSERWLEAGSDIGMMHVDARGTGHDGQPLALRWLITAEHGDGPEIPATPAVALTRALRDGRLKTKGARPCLDLFTLDAIEAELAPFHITNTLTTLDV